LLFPLLPRDSFAQSEGAQEPSSTAKL